MSGDGRPVVAVCIPVYNAERFLAAAVESVLAQDFGAWEMVLVDDGSTDGSLAVAGELAGRDPRITVHRNERNLGAAATWNRAVALTTAPYVKLLCDDDTLLPGCLTTQVAVLDADADGSIGMVTGLRDLIRADGTVLRRGHGLRGVGRQRTKIDRRGLVEAMLRNGGNPLGETSTALLRRDALARAGGFPQRWQYVIDVATYAAISRTSDIAVVRERLATFRVSGGSWSAALARRQAAETRRLLRELAAEEDVGRLRLWRGQAMAWGMQHVRRAATALSERRARRS